MELRPFTKEDWYAFSGCEERPGEPPMIGEIEHVEGTERGTGATVVVDQTAVSVLWHTGEDEPMIYVLPASYRAGLAIAQLLPESSISTDRLLGLGFEMVN